MPDWDEQAQAAQARYEDGAARLPDEPDERQRQLTRMANASWAAGLSLLMAGRLDHARTWLLRAAEIYRRSWADAPPDSWGRPIAAVKARLIAGDGAGAEADATWAVGLGATRSESPIGRYAATLALLVLVDDPGAAVLASTLLGEETVPESVTDALSALAEHDAGGYESAIRALLEDFEVREEFLEDVPVADTVLALQALTEPRGLGVALESPLLPPG